MVPKENVLTTHRTRSVLVLVVFLCYVCARACSLEVRERVMYRERAHRQTQSVLLCAWFSSCVLLLCFEMREPVVHWCKVHSKEDYLSLCTDYTLYLVSSSEVSCALLLCFETHKPVRDAWTSWVPQGNTTNCTVTTDRIWSSVYACMCLKIHIYIYIHAGTPTLMVCTCMCV